MKLYFFLFTSTLLLGCNQLPQKTIITYASKRAEIIDSLKNCENIQDSLVCLNRFAYRDALHGEYEYNINNIDTNNTHWNWSVEKWYSLFGKDSLTVYCAGNANFLNSLYREFIPNKVLSHGFSIGIPNKNIGHYISLVVLLKNNQHNFYLFDPMFNSEYVDKNGDLIDLRTMIYYLRTNQSDKFEINNRIENAQYLQKDTTLSDGNGIYDLVFQHSFAHSVNDKLYVLYCPRTLDDYLDDKFSDTYVEIANFYGKSDLEFKSSDEFKLCIPFIKDIYGMYSEDIKNEIYFYLSGDLNTIDSLIQYNNLYK